MSASRSSTLAASHSCTPDPYLTEDRLASIFEDFTAKILRFTPSGTVFTHLVNNVRSQYMSQLLQQQQVLADHSAQYELQLASAREQQLAEVAELRAEHERQRSELIESYNYKLQTATVSSGRKIAPRGWISDIEICFNGEGSHAPRDRVLELTYHSNDINFGFDAGCGVRPVPKYQERPTSAMTSIEVDILTNSDGRRDLAKGAGGKFRHLTPKYYQSQWKIHTVNLLRLSHGIGDLPEGFTGHSWDINEGRSGDFLYLIWKAILGSVE